MARPRLCALTAAALGACSLVPAALTTPAAEAVGRTFYVDASTRALALFRNGSAERPFKTVAEVETALRRTGLLGPRIADGDTVLFRAGQAWTTETLDVSRGVTIGRYDGAVAGAPPPELCLTVAGAHVTVTEIVTAGCAGPGITVAGVASDVAIHHNIAFGSTAGATFVDVEPGARDVRIRNNTVHLTGAGSRGVVCDDGCGADVLTELRGNVLSTAGAPYTTDGVSGRDNVFWGGEPIHTGAASYPFGPGEDHNDPELADPASGDFRLTDGSPAIDRVGGLGGLDGNGNGTARVDAGALEHPAVAEQPSRLGVFNAGWNPDDDCTKTLPLFGALPEIAVNYLGADEPLVGDTGVPHDRFYRQRARILRGTSPLLTLTTARFHLPTGTVEHPDLIERLDAGDPAAVAWLQRYVDALGALAQVDPDVPVYAAFEHEYGVKVNQGLFAPGSPSADPVVFGRALDRFLRMVEVENATLTDGARIRTVYWMAGNDYHQADQALEGDVAEQLTTLPDVIGFDPYATASGAQRLADITARDLAWIRSQQEWYVDQPIVLPEIGMKVAFGDESLRAFYTGLRAAMRALHIAWGVQFNSPRDFDTQVAGRTDGQLFEQARAALAAELQQQPAAGTC